MGGRIDAGGVDPGDWGCFGKMGIPAEWGAEFSFPRIPLGERAWMGENMPFPRLWSGQNDKEAALMHTGYRQNYRIIA